MARAIRLLYPESSRASSTWAAGAIDMSEHQPSDWTLANWAELATAISTPLTLISVIIAAAAFYFTRYQHTAALRNFNETLKSNYYA